MPHITEDILAVLRCPVTGSTLVQEGDSLVSTANGPAGEPLRYAVADGIPLLLRPSAGPAGTDTDTAGTNPDGAV